MYEASRKNIEYQLKYSLAKTIFHTTCTDIRLHLQDSIRSWHQGHQKGQTFVSLLTKVSLKRQLPQKQGILDFAAASIKLSATISPSTTAYAVFVLQILNLKSYHNQQYFILQLMCF